MVSNTIIVVGGPAGTGKTTIAQLLADHFQCPFIEGDSLHPQANIDKMSKGLPLTDEDRWDWLKELSVTTMSQSMDSSNKSNIAIVSCSMLKKIYRDYIRENSTQDNSANLQFRFVFLHTSFENLLQRVNNRQGHYMKSNMVKSQYDIMEVPKGEELIQNGGESLAIDTTEKLPQDIYKELLTELKV